MNSQDQRGARRIGGKNQKIAHVARRMWSRGDLNGSAAFNVSSANGVLIVAMDSLVIKGKAAPEVMMKELRNENLAQEFYNDVEHAKILQQIDSVKIEQSQITLETR